MSTGIVNYKGINSNNEDAFVQEYQVENAFSNLMELIKSRSSIKLLTIRMLKHDLQSSASGEEPFRKRNEKVIDYDNADEKEGELLAEINKINLDSINDPAFSQQFDYWLDKIARGYGYDHDAMLRSMEVKRKGETDNLTLEFTAENPKLAQFMANSFVRQFRTYYQNLRQRENKNKVDFYTELVGTKQAEIDSIEERVYGYRRAKGLAAYSKQTEELVSQIQQLELSRNKAASRSEYSKAAVEKIGSYIDESSSVYAGNTRDRVVDKYNITDLKEKVDQLKAESLKSGRKNPKLEKDLAEAEAEYIKSIRLASTNLNKKRERADEQVKDDLFKQKVDVDIQGIDANKSISEIDNEIRLLKGQLTRYVNDDEFLNNLSKKRDDLVVELTDHRKSLINYQLTYETNENPLNIIENAQFPEWPEPNRQVLMSAFSGIVAGTLTTIALFLLAYFDSSIQSPSLFKRYTNDLPLLGAINEVPLKSLDFNQLFLSEGGNKGSNAFRENLRRIRNALLADKGMVYLFVSNEAGEGKTFTMNALAHSLAVNQKKVLLIDTNFKNSVLSKYAPEVSPNASFINNALRDCALIETFKLKLPGAATTALPIDILSNTGRVGSPSEQMDGIRFKKFLFAMCEHYDFIFLEAAALNHYADARELSIFVDRIIAVFNSGSVIRTADLESLNFLHGLNGKFAGSVLTQVDLKNLN